MQVVLYPFKGLTLTLGDLTIEPGAALSINLTNSAPLKIEGCVNLSTSDVVVLVPLSQTTELGRQSVDVFESRTCDPSTSRPNLNVQIDDITACIKAQLSSFEQKTTYISVTFDIMDTCTTDALSLTVDIGLFLLAFSCLF